jgi:hypothetical protein
MHTNVTTAHYLQLHGSDPCCPRVHVWIRVDAELLATLGTDWESRVDELYSTSVSAALHVAYPLTLSFTTDGQQQPDVVRSAVRSAVGSFSPALLHPCLVLCSNA